jgi:hypothetical protein
MWAGVTFMPTRQTHPRTDIQESQRSKFSEFARNGPCELIRPCSNRTASKCEQAWHSYEQDKRMHVQSHSPVNDVSSPSSLGMEPLSWLDPVQKIEWQGNVSKREMHANKTNESTYRATVDSTTSVLWVRSEWNLWVDYDLFKQNGKEMWASVTFMPTRQTNARTEIQLSQRRQFSKFARNGTCELIIIC